MEFIKKYLKCVVSIIVIAIIIIIILVQNNEQKEILLQEEIIENEFNQPEDIKDNITNKVKIDIKGEVKKPGVYELDSTSCVNDAIEISGGLTDKADTTLINLSKKLKDEMVIIIYSKDEIKKFQENEKETIIKYIEKECTCPDNINDACINEYSSDKTTKNQKININEASLEEIQNIKGIGETKAKAIIKYRNEKRFDSIEEITNVDGIGESTFEKIKDLITI